jgi:hypothetical protein
MPAMSKRLLLVAAAMAALWSGPAGALSLCPDEEGNYTPAACDLIWPFEPDPDRVECDIIADMEAAEAHPVCLDYYIKRWRLDADAVKRLRVPT